MLRQVSRPQPKSPSPAGATPGTLPAKANTVLSLFGLRGNGLGKKCGCSRSEVLMGYCRRFSALPES